MIRVSEILYCRPLRDPVVEVWDDGRDSGLLKHYDSSAVAQVIKITSRT